MRWWVKGVRLVYEMCVPSDAPTMVLLHALVNGTDWAPVRTRFAALFRVLTPDLRGHGDSDWTGSYLFQHRGLAIPSRLVDTESLDFDWAVVPAFVGELNAGRSSDLGGADQDHCSHTADWRWARQPHSAAQACRRCDSHSALWPGDYRRWTSRAFFPAGGLR